MRNSEHIVRYITTGAWFSYIVSDETKEFYKDIRKHLEEHESKINTPPQDLSPQENDSKKIYDKVSDHIEFKDIANEFTSEDEEAHVVLLLGPTGSGKSSIANLLFNQHVVKASDDAKSQTKNCTFLQGDYGPPGTSKKVIVVDTVGYCDSIISDDDIELMIKNQIKSKNLKIDRVLILCYGRIQKAHVTELKKMLKWLEYEKHKENFVFLYNKADQVKEIKDRNKNLLQMCALLGVDPDITVNLGEGHSTSPLARYVSFPPNAQQKTVAQDLEYLKRVALGKHTVDKIEQPVSSFFSFKCNIL